jgi:membrane protease YdiL (CAAX protease family)
LKVVEEINEGETALAVEDRREGLPGGRRLAVWEIVSVTLSFLMAEWMFLPLTDNSKLFGSIPLLFAFVLIGISHRAHGETATQIGWRIDNFFSAIRLLLLPMFGTAILIMAIGWLSNSVRLDNLQSWHTLLWLPALALAEQYVLQGFINRRAQMIWGEGYRSIMLVASIFTLLHLPNLWLAIAMLFGGLLWAVVYQRVPNLIALALSQSLISLLLVWALPPLMLKSLRIGFNYFG